MKNKLLSILLVLAMVFSMTACSGGSEENIEPTDKIVFKEAGHGGTIAAYFSEYEQYFYNPEDWGVEEAYKAYGPNFTTTVNAELIENLEGKIWIIDKIDKSLYNELFNNESYKLISEKEFWTKYHGYSMSMILVEKIN